ncbi:hypothetical protein BKA56DRAFT_594476 [Ilyonectria sp. MPI-CAGE-AT-0026]|nr:hypothetical protein BKA56DRAFT_594476 [Ilyonectria sp. MPI-CAGE-AT-0026]
MSVQVPPFEFKPFEYTKLPSSSIRLLSFLKRSDPIEPNSISGVPLIECFLESVDINTNPNYDALSYTWGNPHERPNSIIDDYAITHKWPIAVNGRLAYVNKNLYEGLCHLRQVRITENADEIDRRQKPFSNAEMIRAAEERKLRDNYDIDRRLWRYNKTELIYVAESGKLKDMETCIWLGADLQSKDCFGETALHYAAENGRLEIVKTLLEYGADLTVLDSARRTPLMCCLQRKRGQHQKVAELIRSWKGPGEKLKQFHDWKASGRPSVPATTIFKIGGPFWIDSVCVNQSNIAERNEQVAMMSQTYGAAQSVIAWLGVADHNTKAARDALSIVGQNDTKNLRASFSRYYQQLGRVDEDDKPNGILLSINDVRAVMELLQRCWFRRTWVVQEVALAKEITLYCGPYKFHWLEIFVLLQRDLGSFGEQFYRTMNGKPTNKYDNLSSGWTRRSGVSALVDIRVRTRPDITESKNIRVVPKGRWIKAWRSKLTLPVLLVLTWETMATDPRDCIIALLSVANTQEASTKIIADYSKSTSELFAETGKILIEAKGDNRVQHLSRDYIEDFEPLEILSFIQAPLTPRERPAGMPSWVPMFHWPLTTGRIFWPTLHAAGNTALALYPSNPSILKLDGFIFDTIVEIESQPSEAINYASWLIITSHLDPVYPTGMSRVEALWRSILAETIPSDKFTICKQAFKDLFTPLARRNTSIAQQINVLRESDTANFLPSIDEIKRDSRSLGRGKPDFLRLGIQHGYRNRCLMRTKKGYLVLGPRASMVNDQVSLLSGGRTAYILRPQEIPGQYSFVGEAFVAGIMQGEALLDKEFKFVPIELV